MPTTCALVVTTLTNQNEAGNLANRAVKQRLAACVQIHPKCESYFMWEGKLQIESELTMVFKTTLSHAKILGDWLKEHHPYDEPEIIVLPIDNSSSQSYLAWIESSVGLL